LDSKLPPLLPLMRPMECTMPTTAPLHLLRHAHAAVALMDAKGNACVTINVDLVGVSETMTAAVREHMRAKCGLAPDCVRVIATHTHSGPCIASSLHAPHPCNPLLESRAEQEVHHTPPIPPTRCMCMLIQQHACTSALICTEAFMQARVAWYYALTWTIPCVCMFSLSAGSPTLFCLLEGGGVHKQRDHIDERSCRGCVCSPPPPNTHTLI